MKNILVTGGFGFLGSHLLDVLVERHPEASIYVVDDLSSNAVNPRLFMHGKNTEHFNCNIAEFVLDYDLKGINFSEIYHLASIVGPAGVLPHTGRIANSIVGNASLVINLAKREGAKLVFVSTSEVYGGGQDGYCSEEMDCIITQEPSARLEYAVGKLAAEVMLLNQTKARMVEAVIIRPFNIAGARQSPVGGFVLPRFLKAAQDDKPLTVFGDGSQVRALTDARDVAEGIYLAMLRGESGEVYNIGNEDNKITIEELAQAVINITGKGVIDHVDPKDLFGESYVEANDKYPNSTKARVDLGWKPKYDIEQIIKSALHERGSK